MLLRMRKLMSKNPPVGNGPGHRGRVPGGLKGRKGDPPPFCFEYVPWHGLEHFPEEVLTLFCLKSRFGIGRTAVHGIEG